MRKDEKGYGHMVSTRGTELMQREVGAFANPSSYASWLERHHLKTPLGAIMKRVSVYSSLDNLEVEPRPVTITSRMFLQGALPALQLCTKFLTPESRNQMVNEANRFYNDRLGKSIPEAMTDQRERRLYHAAEAIIIRAQAGWVQAEPLQSVVSNWIERTTDQTSKNIFVTHGFGFVIDLATRVYNQEVADGQATIDAMHQADQHYDWDAEFQSMLQPPQE